MKILLDLGHPAHVHYFKNFIEIMQNKGHEFVTIAREKDVTQDLLKEYQIPYISRGKGKSSKFGKFINLLKTNLLLYRVAKKEKPDLMMGFSGVYIAQIGKILNIETIVIDDTEHAHLAHKLYVPFANHIITPDHFRKDFGEKHHRIDTIFELAYLTPKYYQPSDSIYEILNIPQSQEYIVLRLVNFGAIHDKKEDNTISLEEVKELINFATANSTKVYISSEGELHEDLKDYELKIPKNRLLDVLAYAKMCIGQGGTTGTEASVLGTYSIIINPQTKFNIIRTILRDEFQIQTFYDNFEQALPLIKENILNPNLKSQMKLKSDQFMAKKEDFTQYLVNFVSNL